MKKITSVSSSSDKFMERQGLTYDDIKQTEKKFLIEGKAGKLFDNYQKRLLSLNCVDLPISFYTIFVFSK